VVKLADDATYFVLVIYMQRVRPVNDSPSQKGIPHEPQAESEQVIEN
jgi:hypothetical protein